MFSIFILLMTVANISTLDLSDNAESASIKQGGVKKHATVSHKKVLYSLP